MSLILIMEVFLRTKPESVFQRKALYLMFWVILLRRTQVFNGLLVINLLQIKNKNSKKPGISLV